MPFAGALSDRWQVSAGTGGNPTLGEQAAMESHEDLHQTVAGADMVRDTVMPTHLSTRAVLF